eukprot:TRINITY_DN5537_c0_g1_i3.p1 TRINITY_DN5537_c0_g1~~TRINITY_DN5537_c0_g1_i3.p1  ORF type:complete len:339 (+),score=47.82 TRINITY_DN5537_c0_g1_i3:135-1151(+)
MADYVLKKDMPLIHRDREYDSVASETAHGSQIQSIGEAVQPTIAANVHYVRSARPSFGEKIYAQTNARTMSAKQLRGFHEASSPSADSQTTHLSCVVLRGVVGYCAFLNGSYNRISNATHEKRPVYRHKTKVPYTGSTSTADYLYMYYKPKQQAWVIGLKIGAAGVLAYRQSDGISPVTAVNSPYWMVSNTEGRFVEDPKLVIETAYGITVTTTASELGIAQDMPVPAKAMPEGTSRFKAEQRLLQAATRGLPIGTYVYRISKSMPNVITISVLVAQDQVDHLHVEYNNGKFHVGRHQAASFDEILLALSRESTNLKSGTVIPALARHLDNGVRSQLV